MQGPQLVLETLLGEFLHFLTTFLILQIKSIKRTNWNTDHLTGIQHTLNNLKYHNKVYFRFFKG